MCEPCNTTKQLKKKICVEMHTYFICSTNTHYFHVSEDLVQKKSVKISNILLVYGILNVLT